MPCGTLILWVIALQIVENVDYSRWGGAEAGGGSGKSARLPQIWHCTWVVFVITDSPPCSKVFPQML